MSPFLPRRRESQLHRRPRQGRHRPYRSDCYPLERPLAGWELHPLKIDALSRHTMSPILTLFHNATIKINTAATVDIASVKLSVVPRRFTISQNPVNTPIPANKPIDKRVVTCIWSGRVLWGGETYKHTSRQNEINTATPCARRTPLLMTLAPLGGCYVWYRATRAVRQGQFTWAVTPNYGRY